MEAGTGVICPRCATENPANAKFCQRCWAFLRGRHCPHCGKQATRAGAKYCEHCNRDLDAEPTTPPFRADEQVVEPQAQASEPAQPDEPVGHRAAAAYYAPEDEPDAVQPPAEAAPDDQPIPTPIELPEAPGRPFLPPPRTASRPVAQPMTQPPQPPVDTPEPAATQERQQPRRPKKAPQPVRRSGSPVVTVAVVLTVFALIGAMLVLRKQRGETASQAAASPTQRAAASPTQPAAAPSSSPASPAGAPTQTAPVGGTVKITTTPAGAQVELDWVHVGVTTTPLSVADVRPGKHTIKVSKSGFQSQIRDVQVTSGEMIVLELTLTGAPSPSGPRRRPAVPPPPPPLPPPP